MNVTKLKVGVFLAIMVLLALAACGGGDGDSDEATSEPAPPATEAPPVEATEVVVVAPTEPPASGGEEDPTPVPTEAPVVEPTAEPEPESESEIPYDIAIMEGATNFVNQETSISYRMEQVEIEAVVEFYHTHMAEQGWESLTDSTIGMMATLVYETDEARVSIKLQANNFAETVDVTILVFPK